MAQATTALAAAARASTTTQNMTTPTGITGAIIIVNATAETAAATTPSINLLDEDGNYDAVYWTAAAAIAAPGDFSYIFYPGITAADVDVTEEMSAPIPCEWQLKMTEAGTSLTYSIRIQWLP